MAEREDMLPSPSKNMPQNEHLLSLLTPVGKTTPITEDNPPKEDGAQDSTQSISYPPQNISIKNWISACAQMAETEDMLPSPSENMPQSARNFILQRGCQLTTGIKPSNVTRPSFIPELRQKEFQNLIRQTQYLYQ